MNKVQEEPKPKKNRSPNHPSLPLETAVEKAKALHAKYGRQPAPLPNVCVTMGYKTLYSTSQQAIAALIAYGLADAIGKGDARKVFVSEVGERIIRNAPDRDSLLKKAAMEPAIHKEVFDHFNGELPHDEILKNYLLWERPAGSQFTEDAVDAFIFRLRDTLKYAKLGNGDKENSENPAKQDKDTGENGNGPEALQRKVQVGSFVQWTSQGVDQFPEPLKVAQIVDGPDGKKYAFVEGDCKGAVPVDQLTIQESPASATPADLLVNPYYKPKFEPPPSKPREGMAVANDTLDEGPLRLEWPDSLSLASVEEFQEWMIGKINRVRRKAGLGKIRVEAEE